ncbi:MAG: leucyl aminopeptidase family protein [Rhizobiales bacterium]|nr:leucyl aminopeptidase family protein [Hyphomicrobiales bacterium]
MPQFDKLLLATRNADKAIPICFVNSAELPSVLDTLPPARRKWIKVQGFTGASLQTVILPEDDGTIASVLVGAGDDPAGLDPFAIGALSSQLPAGSYVLDNCPAEARLVALGWLLDAYRFDRYRSVTAPGAALVCPQGVNRTEILRIAGAVKLTRDLINTPTSDMGPAELEKAARDLAKANKASVRVTSGKTLEKDFPMIHAVGRASSSPPRLIDISWGPARAKKVTLVGKGVCFDTGGLDIKPSAGMLLMKKDMGGAANVLGLASMIMSARLRVRLRVLIPAVENSISANAFRPSDVLRSRQGLTVEIGNTDAEGRLVLADALALADAEKPDLIIDMATLTGAARAALGPDLPPFYCDDDELASAIEKHAAAEADPLWRLPFWDGYESMLDSKVADINNVGGGGFAGSITAGLFLRRFVSKASNYVHFDIYGWTPTAKPGKTHGGEAQGIRALYALLCQRYAR